MKCTLTWAALTASLTWAAKVDISHIRRVPDINIVQNRYLVEIDPYVAQISSITGKRSGTPHAGLYEAMHKRDITWSVTQEYEGKLYTGAAIQLSSYEDLNKLSEIHGVVSIQPVRLYSRPKPVSHHVLTGLDDSNLPADTQSTHVMCGVDKLHAEGRFGAGVKIGIIDSGFDYEHPSLGGCFGSGCKIASGYDFVGDDYSGKNTPVPDNDPMDCNGHGTHVAGIIGANPGNIYNISGVAYKAELAGYRVFGCDGSVADDVLISAMARAYKDGCDVITMSLGGPAGWTSSPLSVVASRAAQDGRIVTIAAGNDGTQGMWYASGPATGIDVISVASVDNTVTPVQYAKVSDHDDIAYYSLSPLNFTEALPVYALSRTMVSNDACGPLPDSTPDLSPYVVLIRRGTCALVDKLANVAKKGARVALIYNNGGSPNSFRPEPIPGALIGTEDGAYLLNQFLAGTSPIISFPQDGPSGQFSNPTGGLVSTFSTYGPTFDSYLVPSIAAPGGGIVSTYPQALGLFAIESGTSMATPYVAGVAALLLEAKGKSQEVARSARDFLQTTASVIPQSRNDSALLQTAAVQGAGLIDAYKMVHYQTVVSPGQLLLNDTANFKGEHTVKVTNGSNKKQTYTLSHKPAGTTQSLQPGSIQMNLYPVPLTADVATVTIPSTITVEAGQTESFDVTFTAPNVDPSTIPVYSGYIEIAAEDGEVLSVTYLGTASRLHDATIIDTTDYFFGEKIPATVDSEGNITADEQTYTFVSNNTSPTILYRLVMGSPLLVFDLVSENTTAGSTISRRDPEQPHKRRYSRSQLDQITSLFRRQDGQDDDTYAQMPVIGELRTFEYNPRHVESADPEVGYSMFILSNNTFANNTVIPNGRYKILMRALKITGDPTNEADYEVWLSPAMVFNATNA
ncbi:subtilisin-like protein [Serendipita vermifera]|nr:subtilisin-like protein [Serendipita vermifera]